jgi:hypothetical protein
VYLILDKDFVFIRQKRKGQTYSWNGGRNYLTHTGANTKTFMSKTLFKKGGSVECIISFRKFLDEVVVSFIRLIHRDRNNAETDSRILAHTRLSSILKMEVETCPETFETLFKIIWHPTPEENILQAHHHLNRRPQQITKYDDTSLVLLWPELLTWY